MVCCIDGKFGVVARFWKLNLLRLYFCFYVCILILFDSWGSYREDHRICSSHRKFVLRHDLGDLVYYIGGCILFVCLYLDSVCFRWFVLGAAT